MADSNDVPLATSGRLAPVALLAPIQFSQLDQQLAALVPRLAQLDDVQLLQLATQAQHLESCAFRLRGACVAELRRRTARLTGGRGKRDTSGTGIKARLARLATQLCLGISTLKTDARIHEVFFTPDTGPACEPTLPRDYYVTALGAPNPLAAIRTAHERVADPGYNRAQFRRDIQTLKQSAQPGAEPTPHGSTIQPVANVRVRIPPEAQPALVALVERTGQSPAEIVAAALLAYHAAQTTTPARCRRSIGSASTRLVQPLLPLA